MNQLTPAKLREWFEQIKNKHNYTDRNLNAIKSNLNHFFWYLVNEGFLVVNPMNQVKFSRKYTPTKSRVILSQIDVMDMLEKMKDHSPTIVYPFVYCLTHTGARREEIRTLKWQDIDFENSYIYLRQTKNGEDRAIRMGSSLAAFLDSLPRKDEFIFLNQVETLLSREQIDDTIASLQRKHPSMKKWRFHDLRHSFAYNYLKRGGEMYALKAILGHKSIQLTVDLYGNYQACDVDMPSPYDN